MAKKVTKPIEKLNYSDHYQEYIKALRLKSGDIQSPNTFAEFIYLLCRDYVPVGIVEKIVSEQEWLTYEKDTEAIGYTNGWLAQYAGDISTRLLDLFHKRLANIEKKDKKDGAAMQKL